jgi:wyosine [tRNA(Phe)-imidazoG37] synthetase (radical SAM superfamily)
VRRAYVSAHELQAELEARREVAADGVTFAGLGEPTLATNLLALLAVVRETIPLPVSLLTGGALIPDPRVRQDLARFDRVVVTVNAPHERLFRQINRPSSRYPYSLSAIVDGLCRLRRGTGGTLAIQVMLIQRNVRAAVELAAMVRRIEPDEVYLNTPLRPALGGPVSAQEMRQARKRFAGLCVRTVYDGPPGAEHA